MLGGVAAGVAETYGLDITLVRVLWVIAGVLWIGVPAYIVAWIVIPPADGPSEWTGRSRDVGMILGLVLVAIGIIVATTQMLPRFDDFGAPLLLIGGGLAILFLRGRGDDGGHNSLDPPDNLHDRDETPVEPDTPRATPAKTAAPVSEGSDAGPTIEPPTAPLTGPEPPETEPAETEDTETGAGGTGNVPPSAWTQTAPWPAPPPAPPSQPFPRRRRRPFLTPITLSVLLIGAGIASLLQATGALDVNLTVLLALATCIVGAALVTAAFAGRAHALILVGVMLLAATAISNTIDVPLRGGIGNRQYRPVQVTDLRSRYELGIGELKLDLRDVPLAGGTTVVDAQTGIGALEVFVPSSVRVEVHAHAGAGSLRLFGSDTGGWPDDDQRTVAGSGTGVLRLNLRVGAGQVRVRRFEPNGIETILGAS